MCFEVRQWEESYLEGADGRAGDQRDERKEMGGLAHYSRQFLDSKHSVLERYSFAKLGSNR